MTAELVCAGCGARVTPPPLGWACPHRDDVRSADSAGGIDHVLTRALPTPEGPAIDGAERNPFLRYRRLSYGWQLARAHGLDDQAYAALVRELDAAVAAVDGAGFAMTPHRADDSLAAALGVERVLLKDETHHVAGSHKARHLFGLAVIQAVAARVGLVAADDEAPLAIASCGNAALAAAVVARAARRRLRVFVPPWAEAPVVARLTELGAELVTCPRQADDPPGDPCHHRFRAAVAAGAVPFSCQGSDNGLTIDGGMTLGFELAEAGAGARLFVQVGGGALASAVAQGLDWMHRLGHAAAPPALHPVQTEGCFPLIRAWRRLARELCAELGAPLAPSEDLATDAEATRADAAAARWLATHAEPAAKERAWRRASAERARYMWPWEREPKSSASGILDDETYDYAAILRAMLATDGWPIVAPEPLVLEAHQLGRATGLTASATGTAGLAGALALARAGLLAEAEPLTLLFTGIER